MLNHPFVSALLVTRNEKDYIKISLMSFINQTYPKDKYEIIIIDGQSDDGTLDIIKSFQDKYSSDTFQIRLLTNEKRILSSGWNIGIKAAKGEFVIRIDAHAKAQEDYIEKCVEELIEHEDATCVGGKIISQSLTGEEDVISKVLSSPFGVGNSPFRVSNKAGYTDTVGYPMFRRSLFDEVGFFDETLVRNQDVDFLKRMRDSGGKCYFNPDLTCIYYTRNSLKKMLKQAFGNGRWNMVLLRRNHSVHSLRHLIPFFFVTFIVLDLIASLFFPPLLWLLLFVILLHLLLGLIFSFKRTKKLKEVIIMPFYFLMLHCAYGFGYYRGLFN